MTAPLTPAELAELERWMREDHDCSLETERLVSRLIAEVRATRELLAKALTGLETARDVVLRSEPTFLRCSGNLTALIDAARARAGRGVGEP